MIEQLARTRQETEMHKAQALAIHCIDLRFQEIIGMDLRERSLLGKFDRLSWPGASKDFKSILKASELSLKLHDPDEIIIYEHEDCGAYGEDNSLSAHRENAQRLATALIEIKPTLKVATLIAKFDTIEEL